jgi:hypothetical protein
VLRGVKRPGGTRREAGWLAEGRVTGTRALRDAFLLQVRVDGRPRDARKVGYLMHCVLFAVVERPASLTGAGDSSGSRLSFLPLALAAASPSRGAQRRARVGTPGRCCGQCGVGAWLAGNGLKYDRLPWG